MSNKYQMRIKRYIAGILLGAISLGLVLWFGSLDFFKSLELKTLDYKFKYRPQQKVNQNIILIAIDDHALDILGRWPWSRKHHAALLESLSEHPPSVIGFDILFSEEEENDQFLAYYAKLLGNVVYAGYLRESDKAIIFPVEKLKTVGNVGLVNAQPDQDGVVRKIPLVIKHNNKIYPSLALQILCEFLNINFNDLEIVLGEYIKIPGLTQKVPIDGSGRMWINFAGNQHVFYEYSFPQVISWKNDKNKLKHFKNKLILVGLTATGTADQGNIPQDTNVPLVAVQANALNTILNENYLRLITNTVTLSIIVFILLLSIAINVTLRPVGAAFLTLLAFLGFSAVNVLLFNNNIYLEFIRPVGALIVPFILITIYRYSWEERERRWTKKAFGHYLSKDVMHEVLDRPESLKLGGESREATVMFLDLHNFTTFCEGSQPEEVVKLLNENFDWMTKVILENGGMLDKYIGDAIMAIFGAPASMPTNKQASCAVAAALQIAEECNKKPDACLGIGIGINTGDMVVGNMGSSAIFNYTAIGDEVNIAMRIQQLTGKYKSNVIISESVYKWVHDTVVTKLLGEVQVKGRKEPIKIWAVLGKNN